jgi:hypothetical protein
VSRSFSFVLSIVHTTADSTQGTWKKNWTWKQKWMKTWKPKTVSKTVYVATWFELFNIFLSFPLFQSSLSGQKFGLQL